MIFTDFSGTSTKILLSNFNFQSSVRPSEVTILQQHETDSQHNPLNIYFWPRHQMLQKLRQEQNKVTQMGRSMTQQFGSSLAVLCVCIEAVKMFGMFPHAGALLLSPWPSSSTNRGVEQRGHAQSYSQSHLKPLWMLMNSSLENRRKSACDALGILTALQLSSPLALLCFHKTLTFMLTRLMVE